nr:hypothetical protein [Tanacetum cinerariifolium]
GNSNGEHNISSWEKRFVTSSITWKQFIEAYQIGRLYENISNWDGSAGEEAFKTAKDAFYVKLYGITYDVKSHNPDLYNNKIDWNSQEDNDLICDFESAVVVQDIDNNHEPVAIFGDALPDPYKNYAPGWGDTDDKVKGSWGVSDDINKGDGNVIKWDDYIKDGKIILADTDVGCKNNDWWDWTHNKDGNQGWNDTDDKARDRGWNYIDNKGWDEIDHKAGDQGWNNYVYDYNNYYPSYGNNNNNYYPSYGNGNNEI